MSYILDALRRAERERDTGRVPSVESLNRAIPTTERSRVPLSVWALAIATALIAATALVVLLWPRGHGSAPPSPMITASDRADRPAQPAPTTTIEPSAIDRNDDVTSLDDVLDNGAGNDDSSNDGSGGEARETARIVTPATPQPSPETNTPENTVAPVAVAGGTPPPSAPDRTGADQDTIAVPRGVTVLREMPAGYREQFPVRTLDVHVYDPDPARRWIMVDGRRYQEGSTLANGPQIVQIVEGGVIFDYQGARVLLPVR